MHVYGLHCRVVTPVAAAARLSDVSLFCPRRAALLCTSALQVALFLNLLNSLIQSLPLAVNTHPDLRVYSTLYVFFAVVTKKVRPLLPIQSHFILFDNFIMIVAAIQIKIYEVFSSSTEVSSSNFYTYPLCIAVHNTCFYLAV
jgi:hypothetical protein